MTFQETMKVLNRASILKLNLDYARRVLGNEEQLQQAQELEETLDGILQTDVNDDNITVLIEFIEGNEGKVSHLNEQAVLLEFEATDES